MGRFSEDITQIFDYLARQQEQDATLFLALYRGEYDHPLLGEVDELIMLCGQPKGDPMRLAMARRLLMLREEGLLSLLKSQLDTGQMEICRKQVRQKVSRFYEARFEALLLWIDQGALLTPFYRRILRGMHRVGRAFNQLHPLWLEAITQSHKTLEILCGDKLAIVAYLHQKALLDPGPDGQIAERCYTVLDDSGRILSYCEAFAGEIEAIVYELLTLKSDLSSLTDEEFGEQAAWLAYLEALRQALSCTDRRYLVALWAEVDRAWMEIRGPIQPGHPMEYYEDRYRCAVAPEWDVRLQNPNSAIGACQKHIWPMAEDSYQKVNLPQWGGAMKQARGSLDRTQLFGARPLLYYGALMDGLFSAQVVPNDEGVSRVYGKKIFAFGEHVLANARMKPPMALEREIFSSEFLRRYRDHLFGPTPQWLEVYDIETVGHELGHVLWIVEGTESAMNQSGAFKLIEEFKATTGGLMAFFQGDRVREWSLCERVVVTHAKRAVELIAWRESTEVAAYYHEALIQLSGLFQSGLARFEDGQFHLQLTSERFESWVAWYQNVWLTLVECYLSQSDARVFLDHFVRGDLPACDTARAFVLHYWQRYGAIGQVMDKEGAGAAKTV